MAVGTCFLSMRVTAVTLFLVLLLFDRIRYACSAAVFVFLGQSSPVSYAIFLECLETNELRAIHLILVFLMGPVWLYCYSILEQSYCTWL